MVSESQATMAIDHRGRVVYATEKLSCMLGYPRSSLLKMDMNNLMPPPYSQMHGAWFRVSHLADAACADFIMDEMTGTAVLTSEHSQALHWVDAVRSSCNALSVCRWMSFVVVYHASAYSK